MRVIECNFCGEVLSGANDEDLVDGVRRHMDAQHADASVQDDQIQGMIERGAYDATDS